MKGAIAWTIKKDEQVLKALEILNNKMKYNSILNGKTGSILITRDNGKWQKQTGFTGQQ